MRTGRAALIIGIMAASFAFIFTQPVNHAGFGSRVMAAVQTMDNNKKISGAHQVTVILERVYLDGEMSEETVKETVWSIEDFWAKYDQWQLIEMEKKQLVFRKNVDDISPLSKANGYFGITEDGVLTIFNGRPGSSRIIQSFFQIDLGKLESRKREQLKQGIPIKSKHHYEKVLETFKSYSKQDKIKN